MVVASGVYIQVAVTRVLRVLLSCAYPTAAANDVRIQIVTRVPEVQLRCVLHMVVASAVCTLMVVTRVLLQQAILRFAKHMVAAGDASTTGAVPSM
jgi:hypothetical protein